LLARGWLGSALASHFFQGDTEPERATVPPPAGPAGEQIESNKRQYQCAGRVVIAQPRRRAVIRYTRGIPIIRTSRTEQVANFRVPSERILCKVRWPWLLQRARYGTVSTTVKWPLPFGCVRIDTPDLLLVRVGLGRCSSSLVTRPIVSCGCQ